MTDATFPFSQFLMYLGEVVVIREMPPEFMREVHEKGRDFSLVEDGGVDSLDVVEMMMELEELLERHSAFEKGYTVPYSELKETKNIGEIYEMICRSRAIRPQFERLAA